MDSPQNNCSFSIFIGKIHNGHKTITMSATLLNKFVLSRHDNISILLKNASLYKIGYLIWVAF